MFIPSSVGCGQDVRWREWHWTAFQHFRQSCFFKESLADQCTNISFQRLYIIHSTSCIVYLLGCTSLGEGLDSIVNNLQRWRIFFLVFLRFTYLFCFSFKIIGYFFFSFFLQIYLSFNKSHWLVYLSVISHGWQLIPSTTSWGCWCWDKSMLTPTLQLFFGWFMPHAYFVYFYFTILCWGNIRLPACISNFLSVYIYVYRIYVDFYIQVYTWCKTLQSYLIKCFIHLKYMQIYFFVPFTWLHIHTRKSISL